MKTMTCRDMGGPCDEEITANTPKEMIDEGMKHLRMVHPEMIKKMDSMSKKEKKDWNDIFMAKWDAISEM